MGLPCGQQALAALYTRLQTYYFLNGYHLLIFRYIKDRTKLTGAISNRKCLFILVPWDKLDLQASRPQIYLLFNNLSTQRSSSSFLFPFIKAQVLMKNSKIISPPVGHAWPLPWESTHGECLDARHRAEEYGFIYTHDIMPPMKF